MKIRRTGNPKQMFNVDDIERCASHRAALCFFHREDGTRNLRDELNYAKLQRDHVPEELQPLLDEQILAWELMA